MMHVHPYKGYITFVILANPCGRTARNQWVTSVDRLLAGYSLRCARIGKSETEARWKLLFALPLRSYHQRDDQVGFALEVA